MNFKLIAWLYVVFVTLTEATRSGIENQTLLDKDICEVSPQIKCSEDCSSLKICYDAKTAPITLKCPANRPFCANGKCGAVNESCQLQQKDDVGAQNFVCTSDGIFPDPMNCTNRYVCDGTTATQVSCNAGYIFDSKTKECVRGTPRIDHASKKICRKISCVGKPNGYIVFPANPAFYAHCSNGSMLLYKCYDVENQIYDISSMKCVFNCRAAGYFPDPSNCTVYYFCKGIKKKVTTLYCAEGHYFDGTKCVNGVNCGTTSTTTTTTTTTTPIPTPPTPSTEEPTTVTQPTPPTPSTESTTFTSVPFPTTEEVTTTTEVSTTPSVPTPPTPTTEFTTVTSAPTPTASTTFTSVPFPTTEVGTTTTEEVTTTSIPTPPTPSTTVTSVPTTASTTTGMPTPPTRSTTAIPSLSTPTTSPSSLFTLVSIDSSSLSTVLNDQNPIDYRQTTKSPFHQSYSLWKHKGKYSIRMS